MNENNKSILLVHAPDIKNFPPVLSLLENLLCHHHRVTFLTQDRENVLQLHSPYLKVINLCPHKYTTVIENLLLHRKYQNWLRSLVTQLMESHDVLWTTTDTTVRELGNVVLRYRHVMQLFELIEDIPLFPYQSVLTLHISQFAQKAWKVVVPEYNRAHIQKTWWHLKNVPIVLPNKPYSLPKIRINSSQLNNALFKIHAESRNIILYQGVFDEDRNLVPYAEAVRLLGPDFCMYIMGKENDICTSLREKFPEIQYIPFIPPPNHLFVTRNANIGILPYVPVGTFHYSELNALFCAPNKIYEYAACEIPMLGSDVPGLALPFAKYGIGEVCGGDDPADIASKLLNIRLNYNYYKANCRKFFDAVDLDDIVENQILEDKAEGEK